MTDRRRVLVGGVIIATVIVIGVLAAANTRRPGIATGSSPGPSVAASIGQAASGTPRAPTESPTEAVEASPSPTPEPTPEPRTTGDPRLAYAEFLRRANDDRSTVAQLNSALVAGIDEEDRDAVRDASVNILDFVDSERDWLREHPPAECYADAHDAANAMLEAYGTAADRFIAWTKATRALDALAALGRALEAANAASDALVAFGRAMDTTRCQ